jgi:ABC-2 type transport system ATP-binding protein
VARVSVGRRDGDYATFEIHGTDGADLRETLAERVVQNGWSLRRLDLRRATLEDRFIQAVTQQAVSAEAAVEAG